jgi:UDP-N-acetylmuramate dehydrogenase
MVLPTVFPEARARAEGLARRTSMGVGGAPEFLFEPTSEAEAARLLALCRLAGVPVRFLGGGTNVIVSDGGVEGAVVATRGLRGVRVLDDRVTVAAGQSFSGLVRHAARWGIPVLPGCPGIPGSVGGAVVMNAGGRHGTTGEALLEVRGIDERGHLVSRRVRDGDVGYRWTDFGGMLVTGATFRRDRTADREAAQALYAEALEAKRSTQPLAQRSAGCTFKNPGGGEPAGRLIESAGLKGRRVGGAVVSERHANFIVNDRHASGADISALIDLVRREVLALHGVRLELEPVLWG